MHINDLEPDQRVFLLFPWWSHTVKVIRQPDDWGESDSEVRTSRTLSFLYSLIGCDLIEATYPFGIQFDRTESPVATMDEEARLTSQPTNLLATRLHNERYGYSMVGDCVVHMQSQDGVTHGIRLEQALPFVGDRGFVVDSKVYTVPLIQKLRGEAHDRTPA